MRRTKLKRWRLLPLRHKLSIYFMAFAAGMLVFLWVFQLAFLETCYTLIKQAQVKSYASQVISAIKSGEDTDSIDTILRRNEMSVYVYDSSNTILEKKYSGEFNNPSGLRDIDMHEVYAYYRSAKENGGKYTSVNAFEHHAMTYRTSAPNPQSESRPDMSKRQASPDEPAIDNHHYKGENLIYCEIIDLSGVLCAHHRAYNAGRFGNQYAESAAYCC